MIDNSSLLLGIAFSGAALVLALVIGWLNARTERYLIHGAAGIALIAMAVVGMSQRGGDYELLNQLLPFPVMLVGFAFIFSGTRLFNRKSPRRALPLAMLAILATAIPIVLGFTGVGTISLNISAALFMLLCGLEFWKDRDESRIALVANAILYTVVAASFLACAVVLISEQAWILEAPPDNWAEDFNSIMCLVGLTGIGAITLTLHHARAARQHRLEANTDELTGVLNSRALFQQFRDSDVIPGLAVIMFDLDHFKRINDRMGHAYGDMVLQRFAHVLQRQLQPADTIARLGGEEFCAILPGRDWETARALAERIRRSFAELNLPIGDDGEIATVSAGMATGGLEEPFSSVLSRSDAALYKAKESGRNQVHVAPFRLVA